MAGRRAYEVSRVLDKVLAEYREPNPSFRGVDYDGLRMRYTQDAMPEVVLSKTEHLSQFEIADFRGN
jgi:hypothetical protein